MVVNNLLVTFLRLEATEPQADQVAHLRIIRIDVSYEDKGEVCRVRKTLAVNLHRLIQRQVLQNVKVHDDGTRRVVRRHHLD